MESTTQEAEMPATATQQPTVYLVLMADGPSPSAIAYEETGEILETVEWTEDGKPNWADAGICDDRGAGGAEGFKALARALDAAEANAADIGGDIRRVPKA